MKGVDLSEFNEALEKSKTIMLSANCCIRYSGRAESFLHFGDRLIIIKADKTLLVHQPKGSNPINYMREGSAHKLVEDEGRMILKSSNLPLKEFLEIELKHVHFFNTLPLEDNETIQLNGTERHMADMLYNNPDIIEKGFKPLSREEHTKFGFIDLFGYDKNNVLVVIECKRYAGDPKAVDQLKRYVSKIKQAKGLSNVRGILACPKLSAAAKQMLENAGFEYRFIKPPKFMEKYDADQKKLGQY